MSEIKRYLIDEHDLEPETELALYRTTLAWAAGRAERFVFVLQPDLYDELAQVKLLTSLGSVTFSPEVRGSDNWISRNLAKLFGKSKERLQVEGSPNDTFVQILTSMTAPPRAIAGDLSPVEDVEIFIGGRIIYRLSDYGRTQILELDNEELDNLRQVLEAAGLNAERVILAPLYVGNVSL